MSTESESKFVVDTFSAVEKKLARHARNTTPWHFEQNIVFDTHEGVLREQGILLRLRTDRQNTLTLKRPLRQINNTSLHIKQLEELESEIKDSNTMERILSALGYRKKLRYEKFRSQWELKGCAVCLDRLPFGKFVEIEGPVDIIFETAGILGLDTTLASAENYHQLYKKYLTVARLPAEDSFCFMEQERISLMKKLGITSTA